MFYWYMLVVIVLATATCITCIMTAVVFVPVEERFHTMTSQLLQVAVCNLVQQITHIA